MGVQRLQSRCLFVTPKQFDEIKDKNKEWNNKVKGVGRPILPGCNNLKTLAKTIHTGMYNFSFYIYILAVLIN